MSSGYQSRTSHTSRYWALWVSRQATKAKSRDSPFVPDWIPRIVGFASNEDMIDRSLKPSPPNTRFTFHRCIWDLRCSTPAATNASPLKSIIWRPTTCGTRTLKAASKIWIFSTYTLNSYRLTMSSKEGIHPKRSRIRRKKTHFQRELSKVDVLSCSWNYICTRNTGILKKANERTPLTAWSSFRGRRRVYTTSGTTPKQCTPPYAATA